MTQLIINGVYLPYSSNDKYFCHEEPYSKDLTMISGRVVTETKGNVWICHYEYDYIGDDIWRAISPALISRQSIPCNMLPDNSGTMVSATMKCTSLTYPTFAFGRDSRAYWHNVAFDLREVKPHA